LKEVVPNASHVALLLNPVPPGAANYRKATENAAATLGVRLSVVEARGRDELQGAFEAMARERVDAVVMQSDPVFFTARKQIVDLATKNHLPAIFHASEIVEIGGLMSYGGSLDYQFRRAAVYVDKILKGARPADLAVEQTAKIDFVINLKTAKALGLTIPKKLLLRADRVIE